MIISCRTAFANDCPSFVQGHERTYEIQEIIGEWRALGRWWEGEGERHYLRVRTTCGTILVLHYDTKTREWLLA